MPQVQKSQSVVHVCKYDSFYKSYKCGLETFNITGRAAGWTPLDIQCQSDNSPTSKTEKKPQGDNIKQTVYFADIPVIQRYEFYLML